ncbi:MAG: hypothetical protein MJA29_11135 [Candidatus Omnitrophica bacterium]|nr:hypothetical protein [Candidatus Omnitrophota bacterium]
MRKTRLWNASTRTRTIRCRRATASRTGGTTPNPQGRRSRPCHCGRPHAAIRPPQTAQDRRRFFVRSLATQAVENSRHAAARAVSRGNNLLPF